MAHITEKDIKKLLENYPELEAAMKKDGTTVKAVVFFQIILAEHY